MKLRGDSLHSALESHLAKYRKLVPALALLNHLSDRGTGPIGEAAVRRAVAFAEYLETHARRAYGAGTVAETAAAKAIMARLRKGTFPAHSQPVTSIGRIGRTSASASKCKPAWSCWLILIGSSQKHIEQADGRARSITSIRVACHEQLIFRETEDSRRRKTPKASTDKTDKSSFWQFRRCVG
jgi:hypothetical protein